MQTLALENNGVNTHNKTKHLIVAPDCFKESLMILKTSKSKVVRKYYLMLEKMYKLYQQYVNAYNDKELKLKEAELEEAKKYTINALNTIVKAKKLSCDGYVYLAGSKVSAVKGVFKIGSTVQSPAKRLCNYQSATLEESEIAYFNMHCTNNAPILEKLLHGIFKPYRYRNEMYEMPYESIERIFNLVCTKYDEIINYMNNYIDNDYQIDIQKDKVIPPAIDLTKDLEDKIEEIRFERPHETIINYDGIKIYYCPSCFYMAGCSSKLQQHNFRANKCKQIDNIDINDMETVKELIKKSNINISKCVDCHKSYAYPYLLTNHYKSSVSCQKPIDEEVSIEVKKVNNVKIMNIENYKNQKDTKKRIANLQTLRFNDIPDYLKYILKAYNVDFDFNTLTIKNPKDIKYMLSKELVEIFKSDQLFSANSINNEQRKLLRLYGFNLNSTRVVINKIRIESYFITFNTLNTNYIPKTKLNKYEILDQFIFYVDEYNNVSIKDK